MIMPRTKAMAKPMSIRCIVVSIDSEQHAVVDVALEGLEDLARLRKQVRRPDLGS